MKVDVQNPHVDLNEYVQKLISRSITRLEKRLKRYHPEACHFIVRFSRERNLFQCGLELRAIQKRLAVKKEADDLVTAFKHAYGALIKEFEKYRLKINKSLRVKRAAKAIVEKTTPPKAEGWKSILQTTIQAKLESLHRVARHELLNFQLTGALEPGEVLPEEVVDEAILRVYQKTANQKTREFVESELVREVIAAARDLAEQAKKIRLDKVSIETPLNAIPDKEEVSTLGEEILYFYEPDEALKIEDVIEDPTAITPEAVIANEELQKLLYSLLSELPDEQRKAFNLVNIEGFSPEEAAIILNGSPEEVEKLRSEAEEQLRKKLTKDETPIAKEQLRKIYTQIQRLPFQIAIEERMVVVRELIGDQRLS